MKKFNKLKGNSGERIAEKYLKNIGYMIIEKNFSTDVGEIDIIAQDEDYLVFVEVKARADESFGFPAEAVNLRKQKKISMVASEYIKKRMLFGSNVRFDVIEVFFNENSVNHIKNAFDSFLRY